MSALVTSPAVTAETAEFWKAVNEEKLLLPRCGGCGKFHWYPRANCPFCMSSEIEFVQARGTGTIYSFSIASRSSGPYAIAYVTLDEGVTMMTNIVGDDLSGLSVGQKVRVVFRPSGDGQLVPMFEPTA